MSSELLRISKRIEALKNSKHGIVDSAVHDDVYDFGRTSFSSGTTTTYTRLTGADLESTVWEVSVVANPNVNGSSSYRSITTGHLAVTRRWDGDSVDWYVYFTQVSQFIGGTSAPLSITVNLDGATHVDYGTAQLRILVSGFSSSADPGTQFNIRMRKIQ